MQGPAVIQLAQPAVSERLRLSLQLPGRKIAGTTMVGSSPSYTRFSLTLAVLVALVGCEKHSFTQTHPDAGDEPDTSLPGCPECDPNAWCAQAAPQADEPVVCTCREGFAGDGHVCLDIDECAQGRDGCDREHGTCTNTAGGYVCGCGAGLALALDGTTCVDQVVAVQVAIGDCHTCVVKKDGALVCWGCNTWGEATPPDGTFMQVEAGGDGSCAIRTDGTLVCWGRYCPGNETICSPYAGTFQQVSMGSFEGEDLNACALKSDGHVLCWGGNAWGQTNAPSGTFKQVSSGQSHACALRSDGHVTCWGQNDHGQSKSPPGTFQQVSAGDFHNCALRTDGTVTCWGYEFAGDTKAPTGRFREVSAGGYTSCGVRTDGTLACWGDTAVSRGVPAGTFLHVVLSGYACAIGTDGNVLCWGIDGDGQCDPPYRLSRQVAAGKRITCEQGWDGSARCWGFAQGSETLLDSKTNVATVYHRWGDESASFAPPAGSFAQLIAGGINACGLGPDGTLTCWGDNQYGQSTPSPGAFKQVSLAYEHGCGVRTDDTLSCWGSCRDGQCVPPGGVFRQVAAGGKIDGDSVGPIGHNCGVDASGALICWGNDKYGQASPASGPFAEVAAGGATTCGVRSDGTLECWGYNDHGQATPPAGTFLHVAVGDHHSCAVRTDQTLACWGRNEFGQCSPPAGAFDQVVVADLHSCARRADGVVTCWGDQAR